MKTKQKGYNVEIRGRRKYFKTLKDALAFEARYRARTGVFLGIQQNNSC